MCLPIPRARRKHGRAEIASCLTGTACSILMRPPWAYGWVHRRPAWHRPPPNRGSAAPTLEATLPGPPDDFPDGGRCFERVDEREGASGGQIGFRCRLFVRRQRQPIADSRQPTADSVSQQPTANSQQPTANSQQPTANSRTMLRVPTQCAGDFAPDTIITLAANPYDVEVPPLLSGRQKTHRRNQRTATPRHAVGKVERQDRDSF
jgi:hypothetical protein